ncbi:MAG: HupE/UreJ family protein [Rhodoblastus sp.]
MKPSRYWPVLSLSFLCLGASNALAHSPIKGLGTFYSHFLDPMVAPAHALLLVATALMLGLQGRTAARAGLIALIAGFAIGLALTAAGVPMGVGQPAILAAAVGIGAAVSLDRDMPTLLTVMAAAVAGLLIGLDCEIDGASARERWLVLAGLMSGVVFFATVIAGMTVLQKQPVVRIGLRIAGSWIVAAAVMVLALSVAQQAKRGPSTSAVEMMRTTAC